MNVKLKNMTDERCTIRSLGCKISKVIRWFELWITRCYNLF